MGDLEREIGRSEESSGAKPAVASAKIERGGCLTILLGGMIVGCAQVAVGDLYNVLVFLAKVPAPTPQVVLAVGTVLYLVVAVASQFAAYPYVLRP